MNDFLSNYFNQLSVENPSLFSNLSGMMGGGMPGGQPQQGQPGQQPQSLTQPGQPNNSFAQYMQQIGKQLQGAGQPQQPQTPPMGGMGGMGGGGGMAQGRPMQPTNPVSGGMAPPQPNPQILQQLMQNPQLLQQLRQSMSGGSGMAALGQRPY